MKPYIKTINTLLSKNASDLLLVGGVGCILGGGALAIRSTPKAILILDKKKEKSNMEKVKAVAPLFIPAVGLTIIGITQIVCSRNITKNKIAAITTAYTVSETAYKTYRDKVKEYVDPETVDIINDRAAVEKMKRDPVSNKEVHMTSRGNVLMYDNMSGRYFRSNPNEVEHAVNILNKRMMSEMYILLNDFYQEIGLPIAKVGAQLGWHIDSDIINIRFGSDIAENGEPCLTLDYEVGPL